MMEQTPDLMEYLARLSRMTRRRPALHHPHISRGAYRLIAIAMKQDGIRTSELAEQLDIRPSSLTEVLKKLEEAGYILRERDEKDSRVSHIQVTDRARTEFVRLEKERREQGSRLRECLTDEETETFCRICEKLCTHLEAQNPHETAECPRHGHHHHAGRGRRS